MRHPVPRRRRRRVARRPGRPYARRVPRAAPHRRPAAPRGRSASTWPAARSRCGTTPVSARSPIDFDQLHVATGARPTAPGPPGHRPRPRAGRPDARRRQGAPRPRPHVARCRSVVVVGGGYIGLEMAEAFVRWGAEVTLVEGASQLMSTLDADMAARLLQPMRGMGIDVRLEHRGGRLRAGQGARSPTATCCRADLVVLGLGVTPNSELAGDAGADHGRPRRARGRPPPADDPRRRVRGGRLLRVAPPRVRPADPRRARHRRQQAGPGGGHQPRRRLRHLPGRRRHRDHQGVRPRGRPHRASPSARRPRRGSRPWRPPIDATTIAGYLPDAKPMTVKLVAERGTGRLLGRADRRGGPLGQADRHAGHRPPRPHARRRADRPRPRLRAAVRDHLGSDPHRRPPPRSIGLVATCQTGAWLWRRHGRPSKAIRTLVGRALCRAYSDLVDGWLAELARGRRGRVRRAAASRSSRSAATAGPSSASSPTSTSCSCTPAGPTSAPSPIASGTRSGTRG